jgi:hypothetical protein
MCVDAVTVSLFGTTPRKVRFAFVLPCGCPRSCVNVVCVTQPFCEQYLKDKVDAGADCIITQLFYDVDIYHQWVKDCRSVGINVPIIPGIMPIQTYGGFDRMTTFCKTKVPAAVRQGLDAIKDNDEAVKAFGVQFVTDMCRQLIANGAPGLHLYTLNLEKVWCARVGKVAASLLLSIRFLDGFK